MQLYATYRVVRNLNGEFDEEFLSIHEGIDNAGAFWSQQEKGAVKRFVLYRTSSSTVNGKRIKLDVTREDIAYMRGVLNKIFKRK